MVSLYKTAFKAVGTMYRDRAATIMTKRAKNILFIMFDQLRFDYLS